MYKTALNIQAQEIEAIANTNINDLYERSVNIDYSCRHWSTGEKYEKLTYAIAIDGDLVWLELSRSGDNTIACVYDGDYTDEIKIERINVDEHFNKYLWDYHKGY